MYNTKKSIKGAPLVATQSHAHIRFCSRKDIYLVLIYDALMSQGNITLAVARHCPLLQYLYEKKHISHFKFNDVIWKKTHFPS